MPNKIAVFHPRTELADLYISTLKDAGYDAVAEAVSAETTPESVADRVRELDPLMVFLAVNYSTKRLVQGEPVDSRRIQIVHPRTGNTLSYSHDESGIETLALLGRDAATQRIAVVMVTGGGDEFRDACDILRARGYIGNGFPGAEGLVQLVGVLEQARNNPYIL